MIAEDDLDSTAAREVESVELAESGEGESWVQVNRQLMRRMS